jgi:hypothetical protein
MFVPVVYVGIVRMAVSHRRMHVWMCVRLTSIPGKIVRVLVVFVMYMRMRMRHALVHVQVHVTLGKMKPDAAGHERRGSPEGQGRRFAESEDGDCRADERCG